MKHFTIFSPLTNKEDIFKLIKFVFNENSSIKNSQLLLENEKIIFNILSFSDNNKTFINTRQKIYNYIDNINSKNISIKENLLKKINSIKSVFGIVLNINLDEKIFNALLKITELSNGVLFVDNSMMLNYDGLLILDTDGNSEISEFNFSTEKKHTPKKGYTQINPSQSSKENNKNMINTFDTVLTDKYNFRKKEDLCKRYVATTLIASFADGLYNEIDLYKITDIITTYIKNFNAANFFTNKELDYLKNPNSLNINSLNNIILNFETSYILLFTLGGIKKLASPENFCNKDILINQLFNFRNFNNLIEKTNIIKKSEFDESFKNYITFYKSIKSNTNKNTSINKNIITQRLKSFLWIINPKNLQWDDMEIK